jgi:hypothetical protein
VDGCGIGSCLFTLVRAFHLDGSWYHRKGEMLVLAMLCRRLSLPGTRSCWTALTLKMGPLGCLETTNQRCVTSQKSENLLLGNFYKKKTVESLRFSGVSRV